MSRRREPQEQNARPSGVLTEADRAWVTELLQSKPGETEWRAIKARFGWGVFFISEVDDRHEVYDADREIKWTLQEIESNLSIPRVRRHSSRTPSATSPA